MCRLQQLYYNANINKYWIPYTPDENINARIV